MNVNEFEEFIKTIGDQTIKIMLGFCESERTIQTQGGDMKQLQIEIVEVANGYLVRRTGDPSRNGVFSYDVTQQHVAGSISELSKLIEKLAKEAKERRTND